MRPFIRYFLFFFLSVTLYPVRSQHIDFIEMAGKEQLAGATVTTVFQDSRGFIWIGTNQGVFVFDGFEYRSINLPEAFENAAVSCIACDQNQNVWLGFSDGKIAFGHEQGFSAFSPDEGLPKVPITGLLFTADSTLWFSTYGEGLYYFSKKRLYNFNSGDGLGNDYLYSLADGKNGSVWVGSDAGISLCSVQKNKKHIDNFSATEGIPDLIVQKVMTAGEEGIWVGMQEKGLSYFDPEKKSFTTPEGYQWDFGPVTDIIDYGGLLIIATDGSGIIEVSLGNARTVSGIRNNFSSGKRVVKLLKDKEGNLWSVSNGSLFFSAGPGLRYYKEISGQSLGTIHAIHAATNGRVYFGNDKGLFALRTLFNNEHELTQLLPSQSSGGPGITSIFMDETGSLWAGTFGNGLYRFAPGSHTAAKVTDSNGNLNNNILGITGNRDVLWFATLGGPARCNIVQDQNGGFSFGNFNSGSGPGNNFIYTVRKGRNGKFWFGTDGKGLVSYENGRFSFPEPGGAFPARVIYSVDEDIDGNIWTGSSDEGVFRIHKNEVTNFSLSKGLRTNKITSVISAPQNQIVVVHDLGIDLINSRTGQVSYLGIKAGIEDLNADLNAVSADASGSVWIGTQDGIIQYTPAFMNAMKVPSTTIRNVSVFLSGGSAKPGDVFPYSSNHLSFEYIGLWYNSPSKVTYRIMLEGHDPGWVPTGNRVAVYSNLRPGNYTFRVQSSVNSDFSFASEASFPFRIDPPFYTRWWFIVPVILLIILLAYLILRSRINRIKREQQLLKEKAESEFQLLRSQVNPHFLFNNFSTLMAIIEEDKNVAIEYVGKLSAFFRNILEYRDKELIPLSEELEIAESYIFLQKKRYGENLRIRIQTEEKFLNSLIPPLTLQLLIENAVKHNIVSESRPLNVSIRSEQDTLIVENTLQLKKTPEISTGMGLENIRSRYRIYTKREIVIHETEKSFSVYLPVIIKKGEGL